MNVPDSIDGESAQRNCREVGAGCRLYGVGGQGQVVRALCYSSLCPSQHRHNNERCYRNGYATATCFGRDSVHERQCCHQGDCPTKNKEQDASELCSTIFRERK